MVPMSIALGPGKRRNEHVWTEGPNHTNHTPQRHIVPAPLGESFVRTFRKSKVSHTRESFLHSVVLIGSQQLFGPQHTQRVRQIASNLLLPTLAAVRRHHQHACTVPAVPQPHHPPLSTIGLRPTF